MEYLSTLSYDHVRLWTVPFSFPVEFAILWKENWLAETDWEGPMPSPFLCARLLIEWSWLEPWPGKLSDIALFLGKRLNFHSVSLNQGVEMDTGELKGAVSPYFATL